MMKKFYLNIIILFLLSIGLSQANYVDAEKDGYKLYRSDIIKIINLANALAERKLPIAEQWEILRSTVGYFKQKPAYALKQYAKFHKMIERIDSSNSDFEYRLAVQAAYNKLHYEWNFSIINGDREFLLIVKDYIPIFEMKIKPTFGTIPGKKNFFVKYRDGLEAEKDGYFLTTFMIDSMVEVAEFLANSRLKPKDKELVKTWAIKDFKADPVSTTKTYAYFINILLPQIYNINSTLPKYTYPKAASSLEQERERLYTLFYFQTVNLKLNPDLMDTITTYNPVLIEDTKNEVLVTISALYKRISKYKFLQDVIGEPIKLTRKKYLAEKSELINNFVNRTNEKTYGSSAWVSIKLIEKWSSFSRQKKARMTKQMKRLYLSTKSVESALEPMYDILLIDLHVDYITISQKLFFANSKRFISQMFNDFSSQQARILDDIVDNYSDFNSITNLQIGDAKVLENNDDYFVIKYPNGKKYNLRK